MIWTSFSSSFDEDDACVLDYSAFRPRSLLVGKRIENVFAKSCVMEALTEREKEVLLSEIQQIRAVLHPEHDAFGANDLLSSDEEGENAIDSNENHSGMYSSSCTTPFPAGAYFRPTCIPTGPPNKLRRKIRLHVTLRRS